MSRGPFWHLKPDFPPFSSPGQLLPRQTPAGFSSDPILSAALPCTGAGIIGIPSGPKQQLRDTPLLPLNPAWHPNPAVNARKQTHTCLQTLHTSALSWGAFRPGSQETSRGFSIGKNKPSASSPPLDHERGRECSQRWILLKVYVLELLHVYLGWKIPSLHGSILLDSSHLHDPDECNAERRPDLLLSAYLHGAGGGELDLCLSMLQFLISCWGNFVFPAVFWEDAVLPRQFMKDGTSLVSLTELGLRFLLTQINIFLPISMVLFWGPESCSCFIFPSVLGLHGFHSQLDDGVRASLCLAARLRTQVRDYCFHVLPNTFDAQEECGSPLGGAGMWFCGSPSLLVSRRPSWTAKHNTRSLLSSGFMVGKDSRRGR